MKREIFNKKNSKGNAGLSFSWIDVNCKKDNTAIFKRKTLSKGNGGVSHSSFNSLSILLLSYLLPEQNWAIKIAIGTLCFLVVLGGFYANKI